MGQFYVFATLLRYHPIAGIYILAISSGEGQIFLQIEKQGRICRRTKNRKNLKTPVIKVPKYREGFRQGGGQFFWLARIYTPVDH